MGKRTVISFLYIFFAFYMVSCGRKDSMEEQITGTVYEPEFFRCALPCESIGSICSDGRFFYVLGDVPTETEKQDSAENGESAGGGYRKALLRVSVDGKNAEEMENYEPSVKGDDAGGASYTGSLSLDAGGNLWIMEEVYVSQYELPEDFEEGTDDKENYYVGSESRRIWKQLDSTGGEAKRIDINELTERNGWDYINGIQADREGDFYILNGTEVYVLDSELNPIFVLKAENYQEQVLLLGDGSIAASFYGEDGIRRIRPIDKAAQAWGEEYVLPTNVNIIRAGKGGYQFLYENSDSVFGRQSGGAGGEKVMSWSSVDINSDEVLDYTFLEDGTIAAMVQSSDSGLEIVCLKEIDADALKDRKVLTYATLYLDYEDRVRIIRFNKHNREYRIHIRDYSELNTQEDPQAGLNRLNTEMMSGNIPDILDLENLPIRTYISKGLLEDLWPYIEADPDLGREALMERVFRAVEEKGKLYQIFKGFSINTVIGAREKVGTSMSWTLKELQRAHAAMPEGCRIFGANDTKRDIMNRILTQNLGNYVDWSAGECSFDSEAFLSMLEFCDSFPQRHDNVQEYESDFDRFVEGKQMLLELNLSDFDYVQLFDAAIKGGVTYVGYPMDDRKAGSSFHVSDGLAMTSACKHKEGAWRFMREILLPESRDAEYFYAGSFPVNREDFMALANRAMEREFQTDENGEILLDQNGEPVESPKGYWMIGNSDVELYAMTQEQFDCFMDLYNAIDTVSGYDNVINTIVGEETGMYFSGDKTAEETAEVIQNRANLYVKEQQP